MLWVRPWKRQKRRKKKKKKQPKYPKLVNWLTRHYDKERLRNILLKIMEHRENKNVKTAGKKVKSWITGIINKK